jgi:hypothetical protein
MQEAALQEFHWKLAKAGMPDLPAKGETGSAPDQQSRTTSDVYETIRRKEKLKVIAEYIEPLQSACAEEDHQLAVLEARESLLPFNVLRKILRYNGSLDRRQAMLFTLISELRGRAVSVNPAAAELLMAGK